MELKSRRPQHRPFRLPGPAGTHAEVRETTFGGSGLGYALWDAGTGLAIWLALNRDRVAGQRVLELGSGVGIGGVAAALVGAESVVLTDFGQPEDAAGGADATTGHGLPSATSDTAGNATNAEGMLRSLLSSAADLPAAATGARRATSDAPVSAAEPPAAQSAAPAGAASPPVSPGSSNRVVSHSLPPPQAPDLCLPPSPPNPVLESQPLHPPPSTLRPQLSTHTAEERRRESGSRARQVPKPRSLNPGTGGGAAAAAQAAVQPRVHHPPEQGGGPHEHH